MAVSFDELSGWGGLWMPQKYTSRYARLPRRGTVG